MRKFFDVQLAKNKAQEIVVELCEKSESLRFFNLTPTILRFMLKRLAISIMFGVDILRFRLSACVFSV